MIKLQGVKIVTYSDERLRDIQRALMKGLYRAAGYTKTVARNSIKKTGRSRQGRPPVSHTGSLKRNIFFWIDRKNEFVDIGPAELSGTASSKIPGILEQGGTFEGAKIKARPYMAPALEKTKTRLSDILNA